MSHFSEDKGGTLSDPTQRTLLNFIKAGDSKREIVDEDHSDLKNGYEAPCHAYADPSCDHLSELDQNICTSTDNNEEVLEDHGLEIYECKDQVLIAKVTV